MYALAKRNPGGDPYGNAINLLPQIALLVTERGLFGAYLEKSTQKIFRDIYLWGVSIPVDLVQQ